MTYLAKKAHQFFEDKFVRISGANGLVTLLKTSISLFSNKIIALIIGASGIGMVGQLQNAITILTLISSGGFNQGLTKYVAEHKSNQQTILHFISTAYWTTISISAFFGLITYMFADELSVYIFDTTQYTIIFTVLAFTLLLYNVNNFFISIINGHKHFRKYFKINLSTTFISVILSISLVLILKELGALLALVISQSIICILTYYLVKNESWIKGLSFKFFARQKLRLLLKYTLVTLLAAVMWPIVKIAIRTYIIKYISIEQAGIWEATRKINDYIVNLTIGSFSIYLLPRLSEIKDKVHLRNEILHLYKIIIPLVLTSFLVFYTFRDYFIVLLYSQSFLQVGDYLGLQMLGSFFWICKVIPMNLMLAKGKTKLYIVLEMIFCLIYVCLTYCFIPLYGIQGIQLSFAIYNFLYLVVSFFATKYF